MRQDFFKGVSADIKMKDGFLKGLGPGDPEFVQEEEEKNVSPQIGEHLQEYMGEFGKPIGNDPDEIEDHIRQTEESKV